MISRLTKIQLLMFVLVTLVGVSYVGAKYAQIDRLVVDRTFPVTVELSESTNVNDRVLQVVGSLQSPDFRSVANIDISSITGANLAIQTIDGALQTVNSTRARLGGVLNRLDSAIDNLRVAEENQIAARSRIMDADIAAETAALARAQVLQESGIALLVQANAIPMNVVNLLRSSYL